MSSSNRQRLPESLSWRALTLKERVDLMRGHGLSCAATERQRHKAEALVAVAFPGEKGKLLPPLLAAVGLTEHDFAAILEMPHPLRGRSLPLSEWQHLAAECLSSKNIERSVTKLAVHEHDGVFALLHPFGYWARHRLSAMRSDHHAEQWNWNTIGDDLLQLLAARLTVLARRAFLLELNISRVLGQLRGDTPAERLHSFVEGISFEPRRLRKLYLRYPALVRLLAEACLDWQRNTAQLLSAFENDREAIIDVVFEGKMPGPVERILSMGSDPHCGGKQVLSLRFATGQRLVFKPRSLAVDVSFQRLVDWLNRKGIAPQLPIMRIVNRPWYGWVEFIPFAATDTSGVRRYYQRLGSYLALLHTLAATDFHFENLIANGEVPCLVDLEALLHGTSSTAVSTPGEQFLTESVLRTGLLPRWKSYDPLRPAVDLSGLGSPDGQMTPIDIDVAIDAFSDEARIVRRPVPMDAQQNRPTTTDGTANVCDYECQLVAGFENAFTILREFAAELTAAGGLMETFAHVEVRRVLRPTVAYVLILARSNHPDYLRDAVHRELFLAKFFASSSSTIESTQIISSELHDLLRADIPRFTTSPDSRHLYDSRGCMFENYSQMPVLEGVNSRLKLLTLADVSRQVHLIHASLVGLGGIERARQETRARKRPSEYAGEPLDADDLIHEASAIAQNLRETAILHQDQADWIALTSTGYEQMQISPIGGDMYEGLSGIVLFLTYLDSVRGTDEFAELARKAVNGTIIALRANSGLVGGAFTGRSSAIYALLVVASLTNDESLISTILPMATEVTNNATAKTLDLLSGCAGIIAMLLALHARAGDSHLMTLGCELGEILLRTMLPQKTGAAWRQPSMEVKAPLTGASHGTAGIAWALLHLETASGDERFGNAARAAIAYERSVYLPDGRNWPDFRVGREQYSGVDSMADYSAAWCHGAPGIVLMRLKSPPGSPIEPEIYDALEALAARPLEYSDCLCHGEFGNLETFVAAAEVLRDERWMQIARQRASDAVRRRRLEGRWRAGLLRDEFAPGLLLGTAGIGLQLLRLADPTRVPSLLGLDMLPLRASTVPFK